MWKLKQCSMIAAGQSINPLKFTKLHNKTISKHFYESKTQAQPLPPVSSSEKGWQCKKCDNIPD